MIVSSIHQLQLGSRYVQAIVDYQGAVHSPQPFVVMAEVTREEFVAYAVANGANAEELRPAAPYHYRISVD